MFQFLKNRFSSRTNRSGNRVYLGALGKHPAWPEHIIGLANQERMIWLQSTLYERGIRANIDSGEWKRIEDAGDHQDFGHLFLWYHPGELIMGRLWESTDFNARPRYPMIISAICQGLPLDWVLQIVSPRLERLQEICQRVAAEHPPKPQGTEQTRVQAERLVLDSIGQIRAELEQAAAAVPAAANGNDRARSFAQISDHPDMGPGRRGTYRLAFHLQRALAGYLKDSKHESRPAPQRIRVPRCADTPAEALAAWLRFMLFHLDPQTPILLLAPQESNWLDIIIGKAGPAELFCLRASVRAIPLTTQISYPVEPDLIAQVEGMIAAANTAPADAPVRRFPSIFPTDDPHETMAPGTPKQKSRRRWMLLAGAAAAILVIAFALMFGRRGSTDAGRPVQRASKATPEVPGIDPRLDARLDEIARPAALLLAQVQTLWKQEPTGDNHPFGEIERQVAALNETAQSLGALRWDSANRSRIVDGTTQAAAEAVRLEKELSALRGREQQRVDQVVRFKSELSAARTYSSPLLAENWQLFRDRLLERYQRFHDLESLRRDAEIVNGAFQRLDKWHADLVTRTKSELPGRVPWAAGTQKLLEDRAAQQVKGALSGLQSKISWANDAPVLASDLDQAMATQTSELSADAEATSKAVANLVRAQGLLDRGYGLSPESQGNPNAGELIEQALATPAGRVMASDASLMAILNTSLLGPVDSLRGIQANSDLISLAAQTGDANQTVDVRLAAWQRLGDLDRWPSTIEQLKQETALRAGLMEPLSRQKWDEIVAQRAQQSLRWGAAARWARFVGRVEGRRDEAELMLDAAIELRPSFEGTAVALSPRAEFNLAFLEFQKKAGIRSGQERSSLELMQLAREFADQISKLDPSVLREPQVIELLAQLRQVSDGSDGGAPAAQFGPQTQGWTKVSKGDDPSSTVIYSWRDRSAKAFELTFVRVDPEVAPLKPFYLCTTEISVKLCLDLFDADPTGSRAEQLLKRDSRVRTGPRAWTWRTAAAGAMAERASRWIGSPRWNGSAYPEGLQVESPSDDHPMQYISPHAAVYIASRIGCRLPSAAEWKEALRVQRATGPDGPYNLRDATFRKQRDYASSIPRSRTGPAQDELWPDNDIFESNRSPVRHERARIWEQTPWLKPGDPNITSEPDDRSLWFWPVTHEGKGPFRDLIGNVAEFVCDSKSENPPAQYDFATIDAWLKSPDRHLAVIGGSALSPPPPEMKFDEPDAISDTRIGAGGYSDVGFRLAFPAQAPTTAERIALACRRMSYLGADRATPQ